jgi:hypothetical protein
LLAAGIEPSFVEHAVAQPASSIWYPTDAELTSGRVVSAIGARPPPLPAIVQVADTAVFNALPAQFDAPTVNLLAGPAKVQPRQYDLFCRVAIARFRAIAALLPARPES